MSLSNAIKAGSYGSRVPVDLLKKRKDELEVEVAVALASKDFDMVNKFIDIWVIINIMSFWYIFYKLLWTNFNTN